jgi:tRNA-specific 2-thiouridylase
MASAERVLVAMSGGVDSSLAAALLVEAGYDVFGVTLHLWDAEGDQKVGRCCAPEDRDDARRTCEHLGIPHYVVDERAAFRAEVVDPFIEAYASGITPSPCVACNRTVKLAFLDGLARRLGASRIATGHYARIEPGPRLLRGVDRDKDQSYFLFGVPAPVLERLIFPLGGLEKPETRAAARRLGLPNADKPDSVELCFVPDGDVAGFSAREGARARAGRIVDEEGHALGEHDSIAAFTVGQRRGLGLGGGPPRHVLRIVADTGDVVVGSAERLLASTARVIDATWHGGRPHEPFEAEVRIRHRHTPAPATVTPTEAGFDVAFHAPQRAITPGQAGVVYRGEHVVAGGLIACGSSRRRA